MRVENIITVKTFSKCFVFCSKLANSWIRFFFYISAPGLEFQIVPILEATFEAVHARRTLLLRVPVKKKEKKCTIFCH